MRVHSRGIISYAGFDKSKLLIQAREAFIQAEDAVPQRFSAFLPLFPIELVQSMPFLGLPEGRRVQTGENGFSIDPAEYHRMLYDEMPELYTGDNYKRNFDYEDRFIGRGVMTVDRVWATAFPQYQPFQGERLVIYMIGGGPQAVAVPESIYPRGRGVLHSAEADMRIAARAEHYRAYAMERVLRGDSYDAETFEADYMEENQLKPVVIRQKELGRVMQDLSILKNLQDEPETAALYTENAKRAEHIAQYAPWRVACDTFEPSPTTRNTARLMQLYYDNDDFISDFWLPYQDAMAYLNRQDMTLDVRALCEGFQLPPRYDAATKGARYPDRVRVVVVRDRLLKPWVGDVLNNPAYGSGMSPMGLINKRVLLKDSKELIRLNKLTLEDEGFRCISTALSAKEYRAMLEAAAQQERRGELIDAMYRRESALSQIKEDNPSYPRAQQLLDARVAALRDELDRQSSGHRRSQLSGYDADIDYLTRMEENRVGIEDDETRKPLPFSPNTLRVLSVESGYAMRSGVYRCRYEDVALPEEVVEEVAEEAAEVAEPEAVEDIAEEAEEVAEADVAEKAAEGAEADVTEETVEDIAEEAVEVTAEVAEQEAMEDIAEEAVGVAEADITGETVENIAEGAGIPEAKVAEEAAEVPDVEISDDDDVPDEPDESGIPDELNEPADTNEPAEPDTPPSPAPAPRKIHSMAQLTGKQARPAVASHNPSGKMAELIKRKKT